MKNKLEEPVDEVINENKSELEQIDFGFPETEENNRIYKKKIKEVISKNRNLFCELQREKTEKRNLKKKLDEIKQDLQTL